MNLDAFTKVKEPEGFKRANSKMSNDNSSNSNSGNSICYDNSNRDDNSSNSNYYGNSNSDDNSSNSISYDNSKISNDNNDNHSNQNNHNNSTITDGVGTPDPNPLRYTSHVVNNHMYYYYRCYICIYGHIENSLVEGDDGQDGRHPEGRAAGGGEVQGLSLSISLSLSIYIYIYVHI